MRKKLLIDYRFCEIADQKWGNKFEILPSFKMPHISKPVCGHPDLSLCRIGDIYIAEKTAYPYYKDKLSGCQVVCGETVLDKHYPSDIAYNVLISEHTAFANFAFLDETVKRELVRQNFYMVHINQGYARCSTAQVGDGLISADPSVIRGAQENGIDVLPIAPGMIALSGYDYGFIGGASGYIDNHLFFFGDIKKHKNYEEIKKFVSKKGAEIDDIPDYPLTDVGTILCIDA